ncbi:MAG: hypothetical protein AB1481_07620 [Candidatus Omnitrophota bacterium]
MAKKLLFFIFALGVFFSLSAEAVANDKITKEFFGFDFWFKDIRIWQDVIEQMDKDSLNFGLVGYEFPWEKIEPDPPQKGAHSYDWSLADKFAQVVAHSGRQLDLTILPRNNWATIVPYSKMDEPCCDMSPLKEDKDSNASAWGMTAYEAWGEFVFNLVERYDADGIADAPGITRPVIKYLELGAEPDSKEHFLVYGGSPGLFDRMLSVTYKYAKKANPDIQIVRGRSNPGHIFDDNPDEKTLRLRRADYLDFISESFKLGKENFDIFAINLNDHYTGLFPFVRWLESEMNKHGYVKPFMIGDARTTLYPRDNDSPAMRILPPRYPPEFMKILRDPGHPQYRKNKTIQQADEVRHSLCKMLVALASGQEAISLQPVIGPLAHKKEMWQDAGLFDMRIFKQGKGDSLKSRKPLYFACKQISDMLIGADKDIEIISLGENIFAYKLLNGGKKIFFLWHEDPFAVDEQGLVRRNQNMTVNLRPFVSSANVRIKHFVIEIDSNFKPVYPADAVTPAGQITINEMPIAVIEEG